MAATEQMSLIYFEKTGHVLGAFTRTSDSESEPSAEDVVGDALLVRDPGDGQLLFSVGSQHLKVKNTDRIDSVLLAHRDYVLVDDAPEEGDKITASPAYDPTTQKLTVTLPASPLEDVTVSIQIEDGTSQPILVSVDIPTTTASGAATLSLATGTYNVLVLAPGYRVYIDTVTVP